MSKERGLSITGFLMTAAVIAVIAALAIKIIPPYTENFSVERSLKEIANDQNMQNASDSEIRDAFAKKAYIAEIHSISPKDIEIDRDSGNLTLSVAYSVKTPLIYNISLYFDFDVKAGKGSN